MSSMTDELQRSWKEDPENKTKLFRYMKAVEREGQHLSIPESFRIALLLSPYVSQLEYNMYKDIFDKIRFMIDDVSPLEATKNYEVIRKNIVNITQTPESRLISIQLNIARSNKESEYFERIGNFLMGRQIFIHRFANSAEDNIIKTQEYHMARSIVQERINAIYDIYEIEHNINENIAVLPALVYFIKDRLIRHKTETFDITHSEALCSLSFFGMSLIQYVKSLFSMNQWVYAGHKDKMMYLSILKKLGHYAKPALKVIEDIREHRYIPLLRTDTWPNRSAKIAADIELEKTCDETILEINK